MTGAGGGQLILFTGINRETGQMTVEALRQGEDGKFGPASRVAEAPGVVDLTATQLESGEWLVVYSTLEAEDVGNLFPGTKLFSAVSNGEQGWAESTLIAELPDVASELKLATRGGVTALVLTRSAGGPTSPVADLELVSYQGDIWSAIVMNFEV